LILLDVRDIRLIFIKNFSFILEKSNTECIKSTHTKIKHIIGVRVKLN